jgi:hypothetical protein
MKNELFDKVVGDILSDINTIEKANFHYNLFREYKEQAKFYENDFKDLKKQKFLFDICDGLDVRYYQLSHLRRMTVTTMRQTSR